MSGPCAAQPTLMNATTTSEKKAKKAARLAVSARAKSNARRSDALAKGRPPGTAGRPRGPNYRPRNTGLPTGRPVKDSAKIEAREEQRAAREEQRVLERNETLRKGWDAFVTYLISEWINQARNATSLNALRVKAKEFRTGLVVLCLRLEKHPVVDTLCLREKWDAAIQEEARLAHERKQQLEQARADEKRVNAMFAARLARELGSAALHSIAVASKAIIGKRVRGQGELHGYVLRQAVEICCDTSSTRPGAARRSASRDDINASVRMLALREELRTGRVCLSGDSVPVETRLRTLVFDETARLAN